MVLTPTPAPWSYLTPPPPAPPGPALVSLSVGPSRSGRLGGPDDYRLGCELPDWSQVTRSLLRYLIGQNKPFSSIKKVSNF